MACLGAGGGGGGRGEGNQRPPRHHQPQEEAEEERNILRQQVKEGFDSKLGARMFDLKDFNFKCVHPVFW